jgi:hypothetical protein
VMTSLLGAEPVVLKGVPLGAPLPELLARFPDAVCRPVPPSSRQRLGDEMCSLYGLDAQSFGGVKALGMRAYAVNNSFEGYTIAIAWQDYERVRDELRAAYGNGAETIAVAQNTAGARVDSRTWLLSRDEADLVMLENGSPMSQAVVSVSSRRLLERQRSAPAKRGSDL